MKCRFRHRVTSTTITIYDVVSVEIKKRRYGTEADVICIRFFCNDGFADYAFADVCDLTVEEEKK